MANEFRAYGPPGTGKTEFLKRTAEDAARSRGSERVVIVSHTRAASAEIAGRVPFLDKCQVGTVHALCYRALDNPLLVETPEGYSAWNKEHPSYALTGGRRDLDEPPMESNLESVGDVLFNLYQLLRNRLTPRGLWPVAVQAFGARWEEWKAAQGGIDFCDMIEMAYRDIEVPPFAPSVLIVDEAQDLTPLQAALIRKWGAHVDDLVMAGDDDQTLYDWAGATAEVFLNPPLPPEQKRVLAQSYRVPRIIQTKAQKWIEQVTRREIKDYRARDAEGEIRRLPSATWKLPDQVLRDMEHYLADGKTVMVLTSCSYMLEPIKVMLLKAGIPFHNPYRRKRGDWNPLSYGPSGAVSASQRLLAYLRGNFATWREETRSWTAAELSQWLTVIQAEGALVHGAKAAISKHPRPNAPVSEEELKEWFDEYALICALGGDLEWFSESLLSSKRKVMSFPVRVAERYGGARLKEPPQVILGTIHSVKGGESDVVYLFLDVSQAGFSNWVRTGPPRDSIVRQFYVGMTRARESLILCAPCGLAVNL